MRGRISIPANRGSSRIGKEWESVTLQEEAVVSMSQGGDPSWALLFPSDYGTGISNLGFHYVFYQLKKLGVGVERFFHSPIPNISIESRRPLQDFPTITASIAYEPDALNFLDMLSKAGIPSRRRQREGEAYPLIGAAGAFSSINPSMLLGVADFIVMGDGEPVIPFLVENIRLYPGLSNRGKLLERLGEHPSILVPGTGEQETLDLLASGRKSCSITKEGESLGHGIWISPKSVFGDTLLLELQRGCARGCPYCVLPACFSPLRQRPLKAVLEALGKAAASVPFRQVGLVTPEAGDYPELETLLDHLEALGKGVSFASLRIDGLTPRMIRALRLSGRESLTIAPEAGTDRLRFGCGKPFTNALILDKLEMARSQGMKRVKLYFMVGLPGEAEEDVAAIGVLAGQIRKELGLQVSLSVNPFVPKPQTPWRTQPFIGIRETEKKYRLIKRTMSGGMGKGLEARFSSPREADLEYRLSWAGPQAVELLETLLEGRRRRKENAI